MSLIGVHDIIFLKKQLKYYVQNERLPMKNIEDSVYPAVSNIHLIFSSLCKLKQANWCH